MIDSELAARLPQVAHSAKLEERVDGLWMNAPLIDVEAAARLMKEQGYRLSTMTAIALPDGETSVIYHYCKPGVALNIKTATRGKSLPSIANILRAANWIEREIKDLYAVNFVGHPNLEPLIRPPELEEGIYREQGGAGRTMTAD
jgi:NADH:ubiquinone oxidoreductase subunit C